MADENDDESGISEAADSLRGDQWTTYIVATGVGVVVAGTLVTIIVQQVFLNSRDLTERGPSYADSVDGARSYLQNHVLSQLEMKFSNGESGDVACEQTADVEKHVESAYVTKVRCESPERVIQIAVDVIHGKHSMDWDTRIEKTKSK